MSYGHAAKIAAGTSPAAGGEKPGPPIDPALYHRADVRQLLVERDIGALYRLLNEEGIPQRTIARLTGQSQSEVSEILAGRRVIAYDVLVRIADGLGIPRELMGLSWWGPDGTQAGPDGAYGGDVTVADPERVAAMLRRHVIALGPIVAMASHPLARLAELLAHLELPGPSSVPLPSRLSGVHVVKVRDLTRRLGEAGNPSVSAPEVLSAAAEWASRLLDVPGSKPIKRALRVAVAELHIEAGYAGFDAGRYDRTMFHFACAVELATEAGDTYLQALVLKYAGATTVEHGHPDDGLKMLQYAGVTALDIPPDEYRPVVVGESGRAAVQATVLVAEATALADLDCWDAADTAVARARELWQPTSADPFGDLDRPAATLALKQGRLDTAEPFAAASVRRWEGGSQLSRTLSSVVLATVHVRAGEPRGLQLAHSAVSAAAELSSVRARKKLEPLVAALEARSDGDARELARMARQIAATRV